MSDQPKSVDIADEAVAHYEAGRVLLDQVRRGMQVGRNEYPMDPQRAQALAALAHGYFAAAQVASGFAIVDMHVKAQGGA